MKKFKDLSPDEQDSVIHEKSAVLLGKFISAFKEDWESVPPMILEDLSALMHNRHPQSVHEYLPDAANRVNRRVSHRIYGHVKAELMKDMNTSFSETRYSTPFDVGGYMATIKASAVTNYTTRSE